MAICGCQAGCGCVVVGGDGITVGGAGSLGNPIVVALDLTSGAGCDKIMDCVGTRVTNGLGYNPLTHQIGVKLSLQPGNSTSIGVDGGLYTPGCAGCSGIQTVDGLPADGIFGGTVGAGSVAAEPYSRTSYDLALAQWPKVQLFDLGVVQATDKTLWWRRTTLPESWNEDLLVGTPVTPFYGQQWNVEPWKQTAAATAFVSDPLPRYPMSVYQILAGLGGKVIPLIHYDSGDAGGEADLRQMVQQLGLTKSVIMRFALADRAKAITWAALGGHSMIQIDSQVESDATSAAGLVADGILWVRSDPSTTSSAGISKYTVNPALKVLAIAGTHSTASAMKTLGCKGVLSSDPMYTRGPWVNYEMRSTVSPYRYQRFWPGIYTGTGRDARGRFVVTATTTPATPNPDTWFGMPSTMGLNRVVLQGWAGPVANAATTYHISGIWKVIVGVGDLPSQHHGVLFAASHDAAATYDAANFSAYGISEMDGNLRVFKVINGVFTLLGSVAKPSGTEVCFDVQVTPTQVIVKYGMDNASTPSTLGTFNDTSVRGGYVYTYRLRVAGTFEPLFRNIIIS